MKTCESLPLFQDYLTPIKSRKNLSSQNDLLIKNSHGLAMNGRDDKSTQKWSWKLTKILTFIGAIAILIFIVWDYWFRYGWTGELISAHTTKPKRDIDLPFDVTNKEIIFAIGTGSFITIIPRRPLKEAAVVQIQFDDPDVVDTMGTFVIGKGSTSSVFIPLHSKKVAGHCTVTFKSSSSELSNLFKLQIYIKVVHNVFLGYLSVLLGWGYFICWSTVYYPQIYKNWKRRSVVGLSFDYLALNFTGHLCYLVFNTAMYYNTTIQKDYTKLHPKGLLPVKINDVLFSVHAVAMNFLLILQCYLYERGEQKLSPSMLTLVGGLWSTMTMGLFMAISEKIKWIRYVYYLSYIKVGTTPIKYTPQVYLHFLKKSTEGWSIHSVFLDFSGGVLSFLQMSLDAINNDDWDGTYGNPGKLGLSIIGMVFNAIFMVQHFLLYSNSRKQLIGRKADPEFTKKLEDFRTSMLAPRKPPLYDL